MAWTTFIFSLTGLLVSAALAREKPIQAPLAAWAAAVSHVYYINLQRSADRRKGTEETMRAAGIPDSR